MFVRFSEEGSFGMLAPCINLAANTVICGIGGIGVAAVSFCALRALGLSVVASTTLVAIPSVPIAALGIVAVGMVVLPVLPYIPVAIFLSVQMAAGKIAKSLTGQGS